MKLTQNFKAILREASFTKEILGEGVTQIRKANYAKKGLYFLAFTNLSTGLERIGKICLMIDYYLNHNFNFPDEHYLKNEIRHDLTKIYLKSTGIITERSMSFTFLNNLDSEIHQSILAVLSNFAIGDRYSNINFLVKSTQNSDPIKNWYIAVDQVIFQNNISEKKKESISKNSKIVSNTFGAHSSVFYDSESGDELTTLENASFQTGFNHAITPFRQLYILQIIRYWAELLGLLQYKAIELNSPDIPYFSELFAPFCNPDKYLKTRKNWNKDF